MLEILGMRSTPPLPSLSGPLLPGVVAPDSIFCMGQIELNCISKTDLFEIEQFLTLKMYLSWLSYFK